MASYKYEKHLHTSTSDAFDAIHKPGNAAPYAGIYRCTGCGHEIGIAAGHILPSQNHPKHEPHHGDIRWQLVVFAMHNKD